MAARLSLEGDRKNLVLVARGGGGGGAPSPAHSVLLDSLPVDPEPKYRAHFA